MPTPEERAAQRAKAKANLERVQAAFLEVERTEEEERKRAEEEERKQVEEEARKKHKEEEKRQHKEEEKHVCEEEEKCKCEAEEEHLCVAAEFKRKEIKSLLRLDARKRAAREEQAAKKVSREEGTEGDKGRKRARSESGSGNE